MRVLILPSTSSAVYESKSNDSKKWKVGRPKSSSIYNDNACTEMHSGDNVIKRSWPQLIEGKLCQYFDA